MTGCPESSSPLCPRFGRRRERRNRGLGAGPRLMNATPPQTSRVAETHRPGHRVALPRCRGSRCTARTSRSRRAASCAHVRRAEQAGFDGGDVVRPFRAVERRQGESGFAWSFLGAAMASHDAAVRRRQRARPALPPGDRRAGGGDAERDVPRPPLGRARDRRELQRAHHRRSVAGEGRAQRAPARVRRRHARAVRGRGGHARRARHGRSRAAVHAPGAAAAADRRGGQRADRALGGRWADGLATVNAPADHLRRMIDAFRDGGGPAAGPLVLQVHLSWAPTDEQALRIAHDQWRTNVFDPPACWDIATVEEFDARARDVTPEDVRREGPRLVGPRAARAVAARARGARASTSSRCTTSARTSTRSSTPSASTCCPALR